MELKEVEGHCSYDPVRTQSRGRALRENQAGPDQQDWLTRHVRFLRGTERARSSSGSFPVLCFPAIICSHFCTSVLNEINVKLNKSPVSPSLKSLVP